jgi:uncharacterized protein YqjF (DUF2071 family)
MINANAVLAESGHRPWPLPDAPWIMEQSWQRLLFMHWAVPVDLVRRLVPAQLPLDLHAGGAYVGIAAFEIRGLRFRGLPPIPGTDDFPELNLRTYVTIDQKPGVYFFSLDAASQLAVWGARLGFGLPYFKADMNIAASGAWIDFSSRRQEAPDVGVDVRYRSVGKPYQAAPGTLDHFFVERYALYTVRDRKAVRCDIHHPPWTLTGAEAELRHNTLPAAHGVVPLGSGPHLHFAARQDTLVWAPVAVG